MVCGITGVGVLRACHARDTCVREITLVRVPFVYEKLNVPIQPLDSFLDLPECLGHSDVLCPKLLNPRSRSGGPGAITIGMCVCVCV